MTESVLARLAELRAASVSDLKQQWRDLFDGDPPPYNRRFLESRLTYRIQEVEHGGLKRATLARLEVLADEPGGARRSGSVRPWTARSPAPGCDGVEHHVTVRADGFEYQGRPYKSLSAVARAITGTRWNGPMFFGLRQSGPKR